MGIVSLLQLVWERLKFASLKGPHVTYSLCSNISDSRLAKDDKDWISVVSDGVKVTIKANTGVAAALGLHIYLKDYCNWHISWEVVRIGKKYSMVGI